MDGKGNKSSEETLSLLHNITKSTLHGQILPFFLTALCSEKICKLPICKSLASPVMELTISLAKVCAVPWCSLLYFMLLYVTTLHFTLPYNTCIYTDLAPKLVATTSVAQSVERMSFGEPEIERSISTWRRPWSFHFSFPFVSQNVYISDTQIYHTLFYSTCYIN